MQEKINEILNKEGFVDKMLACEEPEQVQALFRAEGIELTLDDVKAVGASLAAMSAEGDELDEDALDAVAGGSSDLAGMIVSGLSACVNAVPWRRIGRRIVNWFRRW